MRSLRVGHDWATSLSLLTFMHWRNKWQPTPVFLPGESQGRGSLVGSCLWGRTESDRTERLSSSSSSVFFTSVSVFLSSVTSVWYFLTFFISLLKFSSCTYQFFSQIWWVFLWPLLWTLYQVNYLHFIKVFFFLRFFFYYFYFFCFKHILLFLYFLSPFVLISML